MAYEFDVFLSYLHDKPCGPWVHDHFLPYFEFQLGNALNRRPTIFVDRSGIHLGQKWPNRLKEALTLSRCLVGIWSPLYFQSAWCQSECAIICHREAQLGYGSGGNSEGLLVGVKVNDGRHFPAFAQSSQYADFEPYFFDGPGFTKSELYVEFQRAIGPLAIDVARVIQNAPPWSAEWHDAKWTDDIIAGLVPAPLAKIDQPVLD